MNYITLHAYDFDGAIRASEIGATNITVQTIATSVRADLILTFSQYELNDRELERFNINGKTSYRRVKLDIPRNARIRGEKGNYVYQKFFTTTIDCKESMEEILALLKDN